MPLFYLLVGHGHRGVGGIEGVAAVAVDDEGDLVPLGHRQGDLPVGGGAIGDEEAAVLLVTDLDLLAIVLDIQDHTVPLIRGRGEAVNAGDRPRLGGLEDQGGVRGVGVHGACGNEAELRVTLPAIVGRVEGHIGHALAGVGAVVPIVLSLLARVAAGEAEHGSGLGGLGVCEVVHHLDIDELPIRSRLMVLRDVILGRAAAEQIRQGDLHRGGIFLGLNHGGRILTQPGGGDLLPHGEVAPVIGVHTPVGGTDVGASPRKAGQTLSQVQLGGGTRLVGAVDLLGQLHGLGEAGAHIVHGKKMIHEGAVVHPENIHVLAELLDAVGTAQSRGGIVHATQLNGELGTFGDLLLGHGQTVDDGLEALVAEGVPELTEIIPRSRGGRFHLIKGGVVRLQNLIQGLHRPVGLLQEGAEGGLGVVGVIVFVGAPVLGLSVLGEGGEVEQHRVAVQLVVVLHRVLVEGHALFHGVLGVEGDLEAVPRDRAAHAEVARGIPHDVLLRQKLIPLAAGHVQGDGHLHALFLDHVVDHGVKGGVIVVPRGLLGVVPRNVDLDGVEAVGGHGIHDALELGKAQNLEIPDAEDEVSFPNCKGFHGHNGLLLGIGLGGNLGIPLRGCLSGLLGSVTHRSPLGHAVGSPVGRIHGGAGGEGRDHGQDGQQNQKEPFHRLLLKGHLDAQLGELFAVARHAVGEVVLHSVAVKAHADADTRLADDLLLFPVGEEVQKIFVLAVAVDGIVADVHLPEDVLLGHARKVVQGILAPPLDVGEKVSMGHTHNGSPAPLGVGEEVAPRDGGMVVQILDEAIVEVGDIRALGEGEVGVLLALEGTQLDTPQNVDLTRVLFLDEVDMVVVAAEGALVVVQLHVGGGAENTVAGVTDAVVVVGDAEGVQSPRNGGLHNGLGGVLSAEGVVGVGMKVLQHGKRLLYVSKMTIGLLLL